MIRRRSIFHSWLISINIGQLLAIAAVAVIPLLFWFSKTLDPSSLSPAKIQPLLSPIGWSLALASIVGVTSTALAFSISWWLWRFRFNVHFKRVIELCLKIPYLLPGFFFAMGWIALAAPNVGYLNQISAYLGGPALPTIYGFGGILFVEICWTTSLATIQLQSFFKNYSTLLEDAALLCGARPWNAFFKITLPIARSQLLSCLLLTMASSLAAFGVPAMLGIPSRTYFVTTKIYQGVKSGSDFSQVSFLAATLMVLTAILVFAHDRAAKRTPHSTIVGGKASQRNLLRPTTGSRIFGVGVFFFCFFGTLAPLVAVFLQSLLVDRGSFSNWSLAKYQYVFGSVPDGVRAAQNSLWIAFFTATILTGLGLVAAYSKTKTTGFSQKIAGHVANVWSFAYATPGTVLALPILVFFQPSLGNTLWIIGLAFGVKYAAFAIRTLEPALTQISRDLEEAAWISGATPARTFVRIVIPLCIPALSAAFALCFIPMLSELTMSVFLVGAGTETLGTLIYRFQEYADPGAASVLAVSVAGFTLLLNGALKKFSRGGFGI